MNVSLRSGCECAHLPMLEQALTLVRASVAPLSGIQTIALSRAAGRVLASNAAALAMVPPCDRSAMDGYAFAGGGAKKLRLVGNVLAGKPFAGVVKDAECVAIATGGSLPSGCDTVAMREHCRGRPDGILVEALSGANVRRAGEDFRAGDMLVAAGTRLDARHLALLAAAGLEQVAVRPRLRVAIFSIGDELRENAPDRIYDANRAMLWGFCHALGMDVTDLGIMSDRRDRIARTLREAAVHHDAIVSSGGTSAGEEDHVLASILDSGGAPILAGVAIKPGKPIAFGRIDGRLYIALPGNPAAALVSFAVLGAPLLRHCAGAAVAPEIWHKLRAGFSWRKKAGVREFLRVHLRCGADGVLEAVRAANNGSAMLSSLAASQGLVCLDENQIQILPGGQIPYRSFAEMFAP